MDQSLRGGYLVIVFAVEHVSVCHAEKCPAIFVDILLTISTSIEGQSQQEYEIICPRKRPIESHHFSRAMPISLEYVLEARSCGVPRYEVCT